MSADEVVEAVNWLLQQIPDSANISRETLLDWEKRGLVPRANYQNGSTDPVFPDVTPAEAFASWMLKHGPRKLKDVEIARIRKKALKTSTMVIMVVLLFEPFSKSCMEYDACIEWLEEKNKILLGYKPYEKVFTRISCTVDGDGPAKISFEKAEGEPKEKEEPPDEELIQEAITAMKKSMILAIELEQMH